MKMSGQTEILETHYYKVFSVFILEIIRCDVSKSGAQPIAFFNDLFDSKHAELRSHNNDDDDDDDDDDNTEEGTGAGGGNTSNDSISDLESEGNCLLSSARLNNSGANC